MGEREGGKERERKEEGRDRKEEGRDRKEELF